MQLVDRIESRRFVGREFLLFLWLESEIFEATLRTEEHGEFGLWLERRLVLSANKESTRITAPSPGLGREAKEALLRGQLPESAGVRMTRGDDDTSFVLKAEQLGVSGLKLATVLDEDEGPNPLLEEMMPKPRAPKKSKHAADIDHEAHEAFYERMRLTNEFEGVIEALYFDFLALRLSAAWPKTFVPLARAWARGDTLNTAAYEKARGRHRRKKSR